MSGYLRIANAVSVLAEVARSASVFSLFHNIQFDFDAKNVQHKTSMIKPSELFNLILAQRKALLLLDRSQ